MTNVEKWEAVMAELLRDGVRSDRQIAQALGCSATFVGKVRKKLEDDAKLQRGKRLGQDGRRRGLPRNMKEMRERLLLLLKGKKKRRKDIQEVAAWVEGMAPKKLEKYLAALEGEKVFVFAPVAPVLGFTGEYGWLSNSYPAPVLLEGKTFPNVEEAFQATKEAGPKVWARLITSTTFILEDDGPAETPKWDDVKLRVMQELLRQKFRIPELQRKLLATRDVKLVSTEGNSPWDDSGSKHDPNLDILLMQIRQDEFVKWGMVVDRLAQGYNEEAALAEVEDWMKSMGVCENDIERLCKAGQDYWFKVRNQS